MFKKPKFSLGDKVVITEKLLDRQGVLCFFEEEVDTLIGHSGMIIGIWDELDEDTNEVAYDIKMDDDVLAEDSGYHLTFYLTEDCLALETDAKENENDTTVKEPESDSKFKNNMLFRELAEVFELTTTVVLLDEMGSRIGTLEVSEYTSPLSQDLVEFLGDRIVLEVRRGSGEYEIEVRLADV